MLLGCVTATVLLGRLLGDPWDVYLLLAVSLVVLPPVVQRWRARYRAVNGSGPSGQDGTD
ncbi:hypothetical protein [Lentzea sp. NEAU-D7]|uniref:hypothetical protein n=1 Tax=Lentzea sp. NEAU-D7 TaxID=2994667 RepID=UPI00224A94EE|nr:hypothetical protein [Lentzea sp. NEAU-D7]MCX2953095.1 hypothetical protein [Lentzea sp. NEAU-D7]